MAGILSLVVAGALAVLGALLWFARQLWQRWRDRVVARVDEATVRRISGFPRRYRDHLLRDLRFVDLKGLATIGSGHPELDEVFVDVSLERRSPHQVGEGLLSGTPGDRRWLGDFLDRPKPVVVAVLGVPGSGKTTLVRHTARQVCQARRDRRRTVPILLYLRDHVTDIVADPDVVLPALLRRQLGPVAGSEPSGWFEQRLARGDCLILFDGLDEVAKPEERLVVARWVERQTRQYEKNDFVITSRPEGYRTAPIEGATVLEVCGFTHEQVVRFVRGWYGAVERESTGESNQDVERRARTEADDLLKRLDNAPDLRDLTVNPLLLTMIANVHRYRGALPGSRVELYGEICQVMLWRRQEAKLQKLELGGERKEALLRGVAYTMMCGQTSDLPREDVLTELRTALRRISTSMTAEDLLADVSSNGLLVEREADLFSFAHLTFQEYLAAMYVRDAGLVARLSESVDDVWWRETTLLYTARSAADPVVSACLKSGGVTALALAFDIADDADLDPELRDKLEQALETTDDDPARLRLRNGVLVTRYLRRFRNGRDGVIPVTNEIYDLCVADKRVPRPDLAGDPAEPVIGVWARDAGEFVSWVNSVTDIASRYRLPTYEELDRLRDRDGFPGGAAQGVWTRSASKYALWPAEESERLYSIDGATIAKHVAGDTVRLIPLLARGARQVAGIRSLSTRKRGLARRFAVDIFRELEITAHRDAVMGVPLGLDRAGRLLLDDALSMVVRRILAQHRPPGVAHSWYSQAFAIEARLDQVNRCIAPCSGGRDVWETRLGQAEDISSKMLSRFERLARPVLDGRVPVTSELATVIRTTALCLAVEAGASNPLQGRICRELAADVTLLERRASGESPPTETVMLVPA